jgi:hypothetical protein
MQFWSLPIVPITIAAPEVRKSIETFQTVSSLILWKVSVPLGLFNVQGYYDAKCF